MLNQRGHSSIYITLKDYRKLDLHPGRRFFRYKGGAAGMIDFSKVKAVTIPEGKVKAIRRTSGGLLLWKGGYKNWVKYSTESDGKTIYNGGLGYKTGYRVRSGGAEAENSYAICTGFIPYKKGDLLRIIPQFTGVNNQNAINFYDSGFTNLGQYNDNGSMYGICTGGGWNVATEQDGITTVDVTGANGAADIAYIRITHIYVAPGLTTSHTAYVQDPETDFIVTVNEEIA